MRPLPRIEYAMVQEIFGSSRLAAGSPTSFSGEIAGQSSRGGPEAQAIAIYFDVQGMMDAIHFDVSE